MWIPPGRVAGTAGVDAHARGAGGAAHALEKSHHGDAGEMGIAAERVQRSRTERKRAERIADGGWRDCQTQTRWVVRADADTTGWAATPRFEQFEQRLEELVEVDAGDAAAENACREWA